VEKAFNANKINLQTARELVNVKPERQHEILRLMESCSDYSTTFARGLVLKTPASKRAKVNSLKTPWTQADDRKNQLLKKLQEAEQQQDFYTGLYRQYTTNLLKLVIYVRSFLNNTEVKSYLQTHHADQTRIFEEILASTEGYRQDAIYFVSRDVLSISYCDARRGLTEIGPFSPRVHVSG
jgi:hypothetical protein